MTLTLQQHRNLPTPPYFIRITTTRDPATGRVPPASTGPENDR